MIQDKHIFECIFLEDSICFADHATEAQDSDDLLQRNTLFYKKFPDIRILSVKTEDWKQLLKKNWDKRKLFSFDLQNKNLIELNPKNLFKNAYGYPVLIGERMELQNGIYEIKSLRIIRYAGLIASYLLEGEMKKVNVGNMNWNTEKQCWTR